MPNLRDKILGADDLPVTEVDVPEWGETVRVKALDAEERFNLSVQAGGKPGAVFMASVVAATVVDEDGNRVFTDDDVPALARKNGKAVKRLFDAADELNAFTDKAVRSLEKN
jgi:hypothetical protein